MSEPDFKIVEGQEHLIRDMSSKAILNTDDDAYTARKRQKELAKQKARDDIKDKERINQLEAKVDNMESMMGEMLQLLKAGR